MPSGPYHSRYKKWKQRRERHALAGKRRKQTYDARRTVTVVNVWRQDGLLYGRCVVFRIRAVEDTYRFKPPRGPVEKLTVSRGAAQWQRVWDRSKPQSATLIRRALLAAGAGPVGG
jgi:hypothetical protein